MTASAVYYKWRGEFTDAEVSSLHAAAFGHADVPIDWTTSLERYGLGWVVAREGDADGALLGFVKVIWDGDVHAFILDTMTAPAAQRRGIGREVVRIATEEARAAGCEWLHVDFEPELRAFYFDACGFRATEAGLIQLK